MRNKKGEKKTRRAQWLPQPCPVASLSAGGADIVDDGGSPNSCARGLVWPLLLRGLLPCENHRSRGNKRALFWENWNLGTRNDDTGAWVIVPFRYRSH